MIRPGRFPTILFPVIFTVSRFGEEWGKRQKGYNLPDRKKEPEPFLPGISAGKPACAVPGCQKDPFAPGNE